MKKCIFLLIPALLLAASCTHNFDDINTNPNLPDRVTNPGLLLPQVIRGAFNDNLTNSFDRGSVAADLLAEGYASNFSNWVRAEAPDYFCWNFYDYIRDLNDLIDIADKGGQHNYEGIALVLRSWMFQVLTDLYGPIPFREAANAKLQGINKPQYEKQEQVYQGLIEDLKKANQLLGSSEETVVGDLLYDGDTQAWKAFADGLLLRLLLRQSDRVDPTAAMTDIVGHPDQYPLFSSYADQASLQYEDDRQENEMPLYRKSNSDYANSTRVSVSLVNTLKALHDNRLYVYAMPTPASTSAGGREYVGAVNGTGDFTIPANFSPPGLLWAPLQYAPDLASPVAAQSTALSYAELQFTLAEAAEKGFIPGGTSAAAGYYAKGIADQFAYYASRIPSSYAFPTAADVAAPPSYYQQAAVAYTGSQEEKLHKIWLQKHIALYLCGFEAWSEWRRTGYPDIQAGPESPGYVPSRCLYPADEMRINLDHYNEAVGWLGADDLQSHVWWDL